ncbi:amidohydrolase family protein [Pedobacter aquatilis]|uniref:amidohydrolase family protein n=1 Tax=Pedobacter aquatilis TaxID=351343 RepID=UPI0029308616|nr:amidohydrolase family protein [Pedobacter aquatilis]
MRKSLLALASALFFLTTAKAQGVNKIIDVHIHCYEDNRFAYPSPVVAGCMPSKNSEDHFRDTYASLRKANVVKAVISGSPKAVEEWMEKDKDHLFIPGIAMDSPDDFGLDPQAFEQMVKDKKIKVFGEIGTYYSGTTLTDSVWQPYLRICEKYDIPVAVHLGGGAPETPYHGSPKARLALSDPFLIEDVLVKYPKLRVYMMHSGEVWYEHAARMMLMYPQLYSDLGVMLWVSPLTQSYTKSFLKQAKEAGCIDRVMFGTDQMVWPGATEKSLQFLNSLNFLTKKEKEGILYNNAARFLRL